MQKEGKFEDLFQQSLEELYDAEKQIVAALPKMIAAASYSDLSEALTDHLEQTKEHVSRLERIFERLGEESGRRDSRSMQALLAEGERAIDQFDKSSVLDMAIVAIGQKVEHYEIASYTAVCSLAEILGQEEAYELLQETLSEEEDAAQILEELGEAVLGGVEEEAS